MKTEISSYKYSYFSETLVRYDKSHFAGHFLKFNQNNSEDTAFEKGSRNTPADGDLESDV